MFSFILLLDKYYLESEISTGKLYARGLRTTRATKERALREKTEVK